MKTYIGIRQDGPGSCIVTVRDTELDGRRKKLPPRLDLFNHSPTGFEWGFAGSGPAQLALALLADALGDDARALRLHQQFKFRYIAQFKDGHWMLTDGHIRAVADEIEQEQAK
jgi:hypothetical protein